MKIPELPAEVSWDYDEEADVLYLSVGKPSPAIGVDIGEGVIARCDKERKEVVGVTRHSIYQNPHTGKRSAARGDR
jgi:hypothetical protein